MPTRQVAQRHSSTSRVRLLRSKLRMLKTFSDPLLLFAVFLPPSPPPSKSSYTKVEHRHCEDDNNVSTVVRGVSCEAEADPTVDQAEEEDCRAQVFVNLGVFGWRLGLFPGAVVEEAEAELNQHCD